MAGQSATAEPLGMNAVRRFLERRGVPYEVIEYLAIGTGLDGDREVLGIW